MVKIGQTINNGINGIRAAFRKFFSKFGIDKGYRSSKSFFASNSIVAKIVFLILVLIGFCLLITATLSIISYFSTGSEYSIGQPLPYNPDGTTCSDGYFYNSDATRAYGWGPGTNNPAVEFNRSVNGRYGVEFTWSMWLYITTDKRSANRNQYLHVFNKGNNTPGDATSAAPGMNIPNNAPGVYLNPGLNTATVVMNTFNNMFEQVKIPDLPLNKWFNMIIRCEGRTLDIYINGTIAARHQLSSVAKQNYGPAWATQHGGFPGQWSTFQYFNTALNTTEIMDIVKLGPDLRTCPGRVSSAVPPYLSLQWYLNEQSHN